MPTLMLDFEDEAEGEPLVPLPPELELPQAASASAPAIATAATLMTLRKSFSFR